MNVVMMVTPDGRWVFLASKEFFDVLGDREPDYRRGRLRRGPWNLGFVKLQVFDHTLIEIELHPWQVEARALKEVQKQVLISGSRLFRIKYFAGGWHSEISADAGQTASRLGELCAPIFRPAPSKRGFPPGRMTSPG